MPPLISPNASPQGGGGQGRGEDVVFQAAASGGMLHTNFNH